MPPFFKTVFGLILVCLVVCVVLAAAILFWFNAGGGYPFVGLNAANDRKLIALFHARRRAFDKLQEMATEDVRRGWYLGFGEKSKIGEARWHEYKQLMFQIHRRLNVSMDGYGYGMRFIFAGGGMAAIGPGWVKGIEYVPGGYETNGAIYGKREVNGVAYSEWQGLILSDLEQARTLPAQVYLRRIEPNWFVFYQRTD